MARVILHSDLNAFYASVEMMRKTEEHSIKPKGQQIIWTSDETELGN